MIITNELRLTLILQMEDYIHELRSIEERGIESISSESHRKFYEEMQLKIQAAERSLEKLKGLQ